VTNVVCIKHSGFYKPEYVTKLYNMVKRNSTVPFRFTCFTERPDGLEAEGIEVRPLPYMLKGWWNKIPLFAPPQCIDDDQIVCLDLDIVITANIDWLLNYRGKFAGLGYWQYGPEQKYYNGSIWSLRPGENTHVWENFNEHGYDVMKRLYSDQEWLTEQITDGEYLEELFPGQILGFRTHYMDRPENERYFRETASIYVFHGFPKPAEIWKQIPWVREHWR
jgi:hypothetical protein